MDKASWSKREGLPDLSYTKGSILEATSEAHLYQTNGRSHAATGMLPQVCCHIYAARGMLPQLRCHGYIAIWQKAFRTSLNIDAQWYHYFHSGPRCESWFDNSNCHNKRSSAPVAEVIVCLSNSSSESQCHEVHRVTFGCSKLDLSRIVLQGCVVSQQFM